MSHGAELAISLLVPPAAMVAFAALLTLLIRTAQWWGPSARYLFRQLGRLFQALDTLTSALFHPYVWGTATGLLFLLSAAEGFHQQVFTTPGPMTMLVRAAGFETHPANEVPPAAEGAEDPFPTCAESP